METQDWRERLQALLAFYNDVDDLESFIAHEIETARREERERCLKALPNKLITTGAGHSANFTTNKNLDDVTRAIPLSHEPSITTTHQESNFVSKLEDIKHIGDPQTGECIPNCPSSTHKRPTHQESEDVVEQMVNRFLG